jgi:colicin import membrane protein
LLAEIAALKALAARCDCDADEKEIKDLKRQLAAALKASADAAAAELSKMNLRNDGDQKNEQLEKELKELRLTVSAMLKEEEHNQRDADKRDKDVSRLSAENRALRGELADQKEEAARQKEAAAGERERFARQGRENEDDQRRRAAQAAQEAREREERGRKAQPQDEEDVVRIGAKKDPDAEVSVRWCEPQAY